MTDELKPSPEAVLVDAIILAYHTTRLRESPVSAHILSKQPVKDALAALVIDRALRPATVPGELVERVARALADADGLNFDEVCGYETDADECDSSTCVATHWEDHDPEQARRWYFHLSRAALTTMQPALQAAVWQPIETARKDRSVIWACLRNDLHIKRADLYRWSGIQVPLRHPGIASDGFDCGWNIAAPVGHGGFPDDWIAGWMPLAAQPENLTTLRSVEAPKP